MGGSKVDHRRLELAKFLKNQRNKLGLNLRELALRAGIKDKSLLCLYENGRRAVPIARISTIAKAYEVEPADIIRRHHLLKESLANVLELFRGVDLSVLDTRIRRVDLINLLEIHDRRNSPTTLRELLSLFFRSRQATSLAQKS